MPLQIRVQPIEHHTGLYADRQRIEVELADRIQRLAVIDHQRLADRLAALRRARTARQQGHALLARDGECGFRVGLVAGNDDADGKNLIDRRIGRVTAARRAIEQDIAPAFRAQTPCEVCRVERSRQSRIHAHGVLDRATHLHSPVHARVDLCAAAT